MAKYEPTNLNRDDGSNDRGHQSDSMWTRVRHGIMERMEKMGLRENKPKDRGVD